MNNLVYDIIIQTADVQATVLLPIVVCALYRFHGNSLEYSLCLNAGTLVTAI